MKTIKDINIDNKRVIIRCDYNVPIKDNKIIDDTRIVKSLKTLNYCLDRASKVIILAHLGRVKKEEDKSQSLRVVSEYLSKLIDKPIRFCTWEEDVKSVIEDNSIIFMENTRFFDLDNKKESNSDEELSKYYASFGDVFINDAFGLVHRNQASNVGITKYIESANGFLVEEEVSNLNKLLDNPERPYYVIMGGAKVSDKINVIENIITKVDKLLIGGAMVYTFLKAKNIEVGSSLVDNDGIEFAKEMLSKYSDKIFLISDNFIEDKSCIDIVDMKKENIGYDIGEKSTKKYIEELKDAKTVFFNGTLGLCEEGYSYGTKSILEFLNKTDALVIIGGGDTVSAVNKLLPENKFILSTGGGAALEFLEGKKLPGIIEE